MMYTTHLDNSFKFFYFRIIIVALFYEYVCFACMHVWIPGASRGSDEGVGTPRTGTTDGCELSCVHGDSNPGCLQSNEGSYP